jgi:hypothetical protein
MDARVKPAHDGKKRQDDSSLPNKVVEISAVRPFGLKVRFS